MAPANSPAAVGFSCMLAFFFAAFFFDGQKATGDARSILRAVDLNFLRSLAVSIARLRLEIWQKTVLLCLHYTSCCFFRIENAWIPWFARVKLRALAALHSMRLQRLNNKHHTCI